MTVTDRVRVPGGSATVGGAAADRGLRIVGLGAVIAGAFGALVPFFGPLIGLNMGMAKAWEMTAGRAVEHLIPGLVGLAGGVLLLRGRRRLAESGAGSGSVMAASLVVLAAGVWFIIGPDAWPVIHGASGGGMMMGGATLSGLVSTLAYHAGPGLLLSAFGAAGLGLASRRSG